MDRTIRLFDLFPSDSEFEARVLSCEQNDGGSYTVVLDRTLFFPEEGGQSADTGALGNAEVLAVAERDGIIYHTVSEPLAEGSVVSGKIDFCERFRKMQNHTGEHIVSGLIFKNFGFSNVGFHLGKDIMTADFDGVLDSEQLSLSPEIMRIQRRETVENVVDALRARFGDMAVCRGIMYTDKGLSSVMLNSSGLSLSN